MESGWSTSPTYPPQNLVIKALIIRPDHKGVPIINKDTSPKINREYQKSSNWKGENHLNQIARFSVQFDWPKCKNNHQKITKQWVYITFLCHPNKMESWGPTYSWLENLPKKMNHQRLGAMAGVFVGRVAVEARQVGGLQVEGDPLWPLVESKFFPWVKHNISPS